MSHLRLSRLKAKFCQVSGEFEFSSGVTGIVGRNGRGKTNLTRGILTALDGRFSGTQEEDIPNGENLLLLNLEFFAGNNLLTVERRIRRGSALKSTLSVKGPEGAVDEYKGSSEVNGAILQYLDTNRTVLEHFVFPPQGKIDSLLYAERADRIRAFQELIGVDGLQRIEQFLGQKIGSFNHVSFQESLQLLEGQLKERTALLEEIRKEIQRFRPLIRDISNERALLANLQLAHEARLVIQTSREDLKRLESELASVKASISARGSKHAELSQASISSEQYAQLMGRIKELKDGIRDRGLFESQQVKLKQSESLLSDVRSRVEKTKAMGCPNLPEEPVEVATAKAVISANTRILDSLKGLPKEDNVRCPLSLNCGYKMEQVEGIMRELQEGIDTAAQLVSNFKLQLAKVEKEQRAWRDRVSELESLQAQVDREVQVLSSKLSSLNPVPDVVTASSELSALEKRVSEATAVTGELRTLSGLLEMDRRTESRIEAQTAAIKATIDSNTRILSQVKEDCDANQLAAIVRDQEDKQAQLANAETKEKTISSDIKTLSDQLSSYRQKQQQATKEMEFCNFLTDVRGIFGYKGLPLAISQACLQTVSVYLQHYLEVFNAPFSCSLDEELGFKARKCGHDVPAKRLSGGEKVILSLAYLLAIHKLFAGHVGLLALDEPTAWLDDENIDNLLSVFMELRELAKNTGQQLLVITHEKRLIQCFDHTIVLE